MKPTAMVCALGLMCGAGSGNRILAAPVYDALGASDAVGEGASSPDVSGLGQPNNGYVYRINAWLHARYSHWTLEDRGVSGYTATDILTNSLDPVIAAKPAIVTVWIGANDVKDGLLALQSTAAVKSAFENAYAPIIRRLRQETGAFIVTGDLPDMSRIPLAVLLTAAQKQWAADTTTAVNEVITRVAAQYNVPVVDVYSDPRSYDPGSFYVDGFHPNDAGYLVLAVKYEAILQANAWRIVSGLGDINNDGAVTFADGIEALTFYGGLNSPTDRQGFVADTFPPGGNQTVDVLDAVQILRRVAGLVPDGEWR